MNLRRQRVVACGAQNTDFRSSSYQRPENVPRIEFISTCRPQKFDEIVKERINKKAPQPLIETQTFYQNTQKSVKEHAKISHDYKPLEDMNVQRVFNGDSQVVPEKVEKAILKKKNTINLDSEQKLEEREKIIQSKKKQHASATQETQLVGIHKNTETLEGKIDLDKVREIRQAIRRRYANRKNFQKIFNAWDEDSKGMIDSQNAYNMINKLGIKVNMDECRVLIASADEDQGGSVNMDEFIRMIFDDNKALNVDLKNIPTMDRNEANKLVDTNALSSQLSNNKNLRHQNQIKQILKNKLYNLQNFMVNEDQGNTDFINFERLQNVFKKLGIPESIIQPSDIKSIFEQYKIDDYKFEYKKLIRDLQEFEFSPEDIATQQSELKTKDKKTSFVQQQLSKYDEVTKLDDEIHVFNINEVDGEHLERIRNQTDKVIFNLKRYFPEKKNFEDYIMKQLNISNKEQYEKQYLKKDEIIKIVQNIFLNFGETSLKNLHLEGFLSSVQYNKNNFARTKDFSQVIYDEDVGQWLTRMQQKLKNPPPPNDDAFIEKYKKQSENEQLALSQMQESVNLKLKQTEFGKNKNNSFIRSSGISPYDSDLKKILQKVEEQVFCGTQKSFDVFKKFDIDKDGYVSQKDIVSKIQEMNLLTEQEIPKFLNYLDPQQKGYLNFNEFSTKIRSGVLNTDEKGFQIVESYQVPDKNQVEYKKNFLPELKSKKHELIQTFNGDLFKMKGSTRFGATPEHSNTFSNFQSFKGTGMYQSDEKRFDKSHNHRLNYLQEEQQKNSQIMNARLEKRREINNQIDKKVENEFQRIIDKDEAKRQAKGIKQWSYEHRCHLKNDWK